MCTVRGVSPLGLRRLRGGASCRAVKKRPVTAWIPLQVRIFVPEWTEVRLACCCAAAPPQKKTV